jgi:membrane-bound metal-dependent hydrolase YbcI (DUF457 family)
MLGFFHLFCGLIIGIIINSFVNNKWIIPVCIVASIIPDIIDKPLIEYAVLSSGRTIGHSLIFIVISAIVVSFLLIFIFNKGIIFSYLITFLIGVSIFVHHIFDAMWLLPSTWFYPFYGDFIPFEFWEGDWFTVLLRREITSPTEWICGIGIVLIIGLLLLNNREKRKCTI